MSIQRVAALGVMLMTLFAAPVVPTAQQNVSLKLTAQDHDQIQELVNRYNVTLNTGDAEGFASIFVADGSLNIPAANAAITTTQGRDALVEFVRVKPLDQIRFTPNLLVTPTRDGATATSDQFAWRLDKFSLVFIGSFDDVLVKTPQGWRFKSRTILRVSAKPAPIS